MGGVEPWCGLEVVGAVDGVDGPFVVVDGGVMVCTQCDEVVDVGVAAAFPGFEVVDLAPCGDDGAAWGLASAVPGQDGAALGWGAGTVGAALVEHTVVVIPDLAYELTVAGQLLGMLGMYGPNIESFGDIPGPRGWWAGARQMLGVSTQTGGVIWIFALYHGGDDPVGAFGSSGVFWDGSNAEGLIGGFNILDDH